MKAHPKFPLLGTTPGIVDGKHSQGMGKARLLFDYLVGKQYDRGIDGIVNYGRAMTIEQIRSEIPNAPPYRTIGSHIAKLRAGGYIRTHRTWRRGLRFWIINQKKFKFGPPRPQLVPSRTGPRGSGDTVEKPVEMLIKTCALPKSEWQQMADHTPSNRQEVAEQVFRSESIKERKSAEAAGRIVTAAEEIARIESALAADDGLPDRRIDRKAARERIRELERSIDQAIEDRRKGNDETLSEETAKVQTEAPATAPAFEQLLCDKVEDSPEKIEFIKTLREIAKGREL